jgi:hypothetical protein
VLGNFQDMIQTHWVMNVEPGTNCFDSVHGCCNTLPGSAPKDIDPAKAASAFRYLSARHSTSDLISPIGK